MPKGAVLSEQSSGEGISHFAAVRMRVYGTGVLHMKWYSLDQIRSKDLVGFQMSPTTRIQPTRLGSFVEQRAQLEFSTDAIDEVFTIERIVIFMKELYTSHPSTNDAVPT